MLAAHLGFVLCSSTRSASSCCRRVAAAVVARISVEERALRTVPATRVLPDRARLVPFVCDTGCAIGSRKPARRSPATITPTVRPTPLLPDDIEEFATPVGDERGSAGRDGARRRALRRGCRFAACLTDSGGPALALHRGLRAARCRDAATRAEGHEASQTWLLKDDSSGGPRHYAKFARGGPVPGAALIPTSRRLGVRRTDESRRLGPDARAVLRVLRGSGRWPRRPAGAGPGADRQPSPALSINCSGDAGRAERRALQRRSPTVDAGGRPVPEALTQRVDRDVALREIARCFLATAASRSARVGPGDRAVTGRRRSRQPGTGDRGYATLEGRGVYRLASGVGPPSP